jgi:hypothetical protein
MGVVYANPDFLRIFEVCCKQLIAVLAAAYIESTVPCLIRRCNHPMGPMGPVPQLLRKDVWSPSTFSKATGMAVKFCVIWMMSSVFWEVDWRRLDCLTGYRVGCNVFLCHCPWSPNLSTVVEYGHIIWKVIAWLRIKLANNCMYYIWI